MECTQPPGAQRFTDICPFQSSLVRIRVAFPVAPRLRVPAAPWLEVCLDVCRLPCNILYYILLYYAYGRDIAMSRRWGSDGQQAQKNVRLRPVLQRHPKAAVTVNLCTLCRYEIAFSISSAGVPCSGRTKTTGELSKLMLVLLKCFFHEGAGCLADTFRRQTPPLTMAEQCLQ